MQPLKNRGPRGYPLIPILIFMLVLLEVAACGSTDASGESTPGEKTALPTETHTPIGDVLLIAGYPVRHVYESSPDSPTVYAETDNALYVRESDSWTITKTRPNRRQIVVHPIAPERLFRGGHPPCSAETDEEFPFSISHDSGDTWQFTETGNGIEPIIIDESLPDVIFGSDCGLQVSTDLGMTWKAFESGRFEEIIDVVMNGQQLLVLDVMTTGDGKVYAINAASPEHLELTGILIEAPALHAVDSNESMIVVGGVQGVFVSLDGGETWTSSRNGLEEVTVDVPESLPPEVVESDLHPSLGVLAVKLDPVHKRRILAGTVSGLYISQDSGATWDLYSEISPDARVADIDFTNSGADLYVTIDAGVVLVPNP